MDSSNRIVGDLVYMVGSMFLGAAVGIGAFLFAIDKYIAIYPVPVPIEVEKPCPSTPDLQKHPLQRTLSTM